MGKTMARNASIGIDDTTNTCRALSSLFNNCTLNITAETPEATGFGDVNKIRLQDGIKDWDLSVDGFWGSGATETDAILFALLGGSTRMIYGPTGSTSGSVMYSACAILQSYSVKNAVADTAQISLKLVARTGSLTRGTFA